MWSVLSLWFFIKAQEVDSLAQSSALDGIVIVGGRNSARTAVNSPVAIDVIDVQKIEKLSPQTTANDLLNYLVPSFNSVRQSASDGTEHIDPATLRGMGPDQVLVLINGKRRHTTSLVNYQNTVGNGSVGTDLTAIPVSAIEKIEVLRDWAAAQYGSDAMAGVINIVLKKSKGGSASVMYGLTNRSDGENYNFSGNYGTKLGNDFRYPIIKTKRMKLKEPVKIHFLEFFKTGKFDFLKPGQTKDWILNNFPDPDDYSPEYKKFSIWRYGNIELHFDGEELFLIFSDYIDELNGGDNIELDKWILEKPERLTLLYIMEKLNEERINFTIRQNPVFEEVIHIYLSDSQVRLGFINYSGKTVNPNLYKLNSFSLMKIRK